MYKLSYSVGECNYCELLKFLELHDLFHSKSRIVIHSCEYVTDYRITDITANAKNTYELIRESKRTPLTRVQLETLTHNAIALYFGGEYV